MQFKYCSFYGISAPVLLLFPQREIDLLFEHGMSGATCRLLANLRYELLALKGMLTDKSVIEMSQDTDSPDVANFIKGLSLKLDDKFPTGVSVADTSSHFTEVSEADKEFMEFMALSSKLSGDLVEYGKTAPPDYVPRFRTIFDVKRWVVREMPKMLSTSEQQTVKTQLAALPLKPSGRVYIDSKSYNLTETHPALASLLSSLYQRAFRKTDGSSYIDYILAKIEAILEKNPIYGSTLLDRTFPQLQNIQTVKSANYHNMQLVNGPLSTENIQARQSVIMSYLTDCDSLLEGNSRSMQNAISSNINLDNTGSAQIASMILNANAFREAGLEDARGPLVAMIDFLKSRNLLRQMLLNYKEILFLTIIINRLAKLEAGDAMIGWGLADYISKPSDINDIGIQAAQILKLGGVYVGYTQNVYDTILITSKAFTQDDFQISQNRNPVLYHNVQLIRRFLLSLKERNA